MVLRRAARYAAERAGHSVRAKTTRGAVNGSRLEFTEGKEPVSVVVRTSYERLIGFSRKQDGTWRPLEANEICLVAVPSKTSPDQVEVYEFKTEVLKEIFDAALAMMESAGKAPANEIPIFVPLDERSTRSLGHSIKGVKDLVTPHIVNVPDLAQFKKGLDGGFVARVRREFAELIGVDVRKVVVEFRVIA